jgi:acylphosphatase
MVDVALDRRARHRCGRAVVSVVRDVTLRVVITGRVQGVGYRAFVEYEALKNGVGGWVRNRRDGSVEAVFSAEAGAVAAMIAACREAPPGAYVDGLHQRVGTAEDLALRRPGEVFSMLATA